MRRSPSSRSRTLEQLGRFARCLLALGSGARREVQDGGIVASGLQDRGGPGAQVWRVARREAEEAGGALAQECLRRGLVAMTYAPSVRINPPLTIKEDAALAGLAILDEALEVVVRDHGLR